MAYRRTCGTRTTLASPSMAEQTFYTASRISANRSVTPDGYMLCHDCLIARTGTMAYGPGETPVRVNDRGFALIERGADEVFRPESVNSINGKPLTDDHPTVDVTPLNYAQLARGHVMRPRRGEGDQADWLVADIMITDPGLMRKVQDGKVELSCGYLAHYVEDAPGRGRQTNIRHNHLAVVDKGRCGPSCRIGDRAYQAGDKLTLDAGNEYVVGVIANHRQEQEPMAQATKDRIEKLLGGSATQAILRHMTADGVKQFKAAAAKALDAEDEDELEGDKTRTEVGGHTIEIHNHGAPRTDDADDDDEEKRRKTEDRVADRAAAKVIDALTRAGVIKKTKDVGEPPNPGGSEDDPADENKKLDGELEMEAPPGTNTGDRARVLEAIVRDSAALAQAMAPGISVATVDRAADLKDASAARRVLDSVCAMRRAALTVSLSQPTTIMMATSLVRDAANIAKMSCADVRTSFRAVGEHARAMKAAAAHTADSARALPGGPVFDRARSNAGTHVGGVATLTELSKVHEKFYAGQQGAQR